MEEIKEKAEYCLGCPTKPCAQGCPMHTNIPEFIKNIKDNNIEEAYTILHENNIFSHICSIVCPQEEQCEGKCLRGIKGEPTSIGELEKFVNEYGLKNNVDFNISKKESNNKSVAIVGAGPAGLECAYELVKEGFTVDVYDKDNIPGGILVYGIPDFRLSKDIVKGITDKLEKLGVKFILNQELGDTLDLNELSNNYDAVFLAVGAQKSTVYQLTEENNKSVYKSDEFLRAYSDKNYIKNLGETVVIGGGNVAMDCARTAVKMGAEKVKILYRRDRAHMPAREIELDDALSDGVIFKELTRVDNANVENGKIVSVNCVETEIVEGKAQDKVPANTFIEKANTVVFAIGLKPEKSLIEKYGIELDDWGYIKIDENAKTNLTNVYAGGDVTESKATVCRALAAGKKAALGIINNL